MKKNYQLEMERELASISISGERPLIVLHSCCAPCSSAVLERLSHFFRIIVYYYNPNIYPEAEFAFRAREQQRLIAQMPDMQYVQAVIGDYYPDEFYGAVRGHESDREGGERCGLCFELRLRRTAEYALSIGAAYFTTTLSISPLKDAQRLNAIGLRLGEELGIKYFCADFKKKDGYRRSVELSQVYELYRQDYCGCIFSKRERGYDA